MNNNEPQIKLFEELIENSGLGYHSVDKNGMILKVNDVWLTTLGYNREDVVGKSLSNFIQPDFRIKFANNLPKLIEKGHIKDFTFQMLHSNGSTVELIFNGTIIKDKNGEFIRTMATFHRPKEQIATIFNRNTEQNFMSISRAELMSEMMTAVAHQWRQPLNALGLIIQDTYEIAQLSGMDTTEIKENTNIAMELVLRMSGIIDEFRDFFISTEQSKNLNLVCVVMQCLKALISQLHENDIDFYVTCECNKDYFSVCNETIEPTCKAHSTYVNANENELKQVLINIISNARYAMVQAMDRGLIAKGILKMHIINRDNIAELVVSNNGMAIPQEIIEKVFDPYFSTKKDGEGLGLGLYFSRILVEKRMKGSININNGDNEVIVRILLPLSTDTAS